MAEFTNNEYIAINNITDFTKKWGEDNTIASVNRDQWLAICELFFNAGNYKQKSQNKWHNEIRERALLNMYGYTPDQISACCGYSSEYGTRLNDLNTAWRNILIDTTEDYCKKTDGLDESSVTEFNKLVQKGGNNFNWDFELSKQDNSHPIKIEFKYIDKAGSGINQLSQFKGQVTESAIGKQIFKGESYCNFFWDERHFEQMWTDVKSALDSTKYNESIKPTKREDWIKSAKCSSAPPSGSKYKDFHDFMRVLNAEKSGKYKTQGDAKKNTVNKSFADFINEKNKNNQINTEEFDKMFKAQTGKCFCILNKNGEFTYQYLPTFTIDRIHTNDTHAFFLITSMTDFDVKVDMSWGNGGAGNNNPRMLISLCNKVQSIGGRRKKKYNGGNGDNEINEDDEDETEQDYLPEDPIMTELKNLDEMKQINNSRYYTRSGRESKQTQFYRPGDTGMNGGKIKSKKSRKTKRKSKKNKRKQRKTKKGRKSRK